MGLEDDDNHVVVLQHSSEEFEYWSRSSSGWSKVDREGLSEVTAGWSGELSDPHHMLESILYHADWSNAEVSDAPDGNISIRIELDTIRGPTSLPVEDVEIVVTIHRATYRISGYSMVWELNGDGCDTYSIEATSGPIRTVLCFSGRSAARI